MDIRTYLQQKPLLFDGAFGTLWRQRNRTADYPCELANLRNPDSVLSIHRDYLNSGAMAIKTNTFAANAPALGGDHDLLKQVLTAGWELARKAAEGHDPFLFADIGPIPQVDQKGSWVDYREILDIFLALGAKHFLFETHSTDEHLAHCAAYIKEHCPDAFVLISFAVLPDGFTREGRSGKALLSAMSKAEGVDAVGLNCVCGSYHMLGLVRSLDLSDLTFSAMPNAGYPVVVGNRTIYDSDPEFYARQIADIADLGVKILGGCCGTTPEHIRQTALVLRRWEDRKPKRISPPAVTPATPKTSNNRFYDKLEQGRKVIAVELDPPKTAELESFMAGAVALKEAGVDAITLADCPIGRARMDSSLLACKLRRELDMDPLPHMTCRDRNLNATKALLLGLNAEGVDNVLVITGDPIPTAERDEVKSVFNFNSRKLAGFISELNHAELTAPFRIFGALNVNARNFEMELQRAQEKMACGVSGFLSQPILTPEALENLKLARKVLSAKILGGIIPVVSYRNACYMDSEINGINVSEEIKERYRDKDREECEEIAVSLSAEIAQIIAPYVDGYYLMTPFQRVSLMTRLIAAIRSKNKSPSRLLNSRAWSCP